MSTRGPALAIALFLFVAACDDASDGVGGAASSSTGATSTVTTSTTSTASATTGTTTGTSTTSTTSTSSGSAGGDYTTNFDLTENPIDEGGHWPQQGKLTGVDWTNVRTANGIAFGTQTGNGGYDDSIALLSGFGPDHRVSTVIHFDGTRDANTDTHEVELILRGTYEPKTQHLYECNLGYSGPSGWYAQIILLDGPIGTFTDITQGITGVSDVKDGDVFMAEVIGDTIHTYLNGVELATAPATALTTGQPGIGFFWRGTENVDDFAYTSLTATHL